LTKSKVCRCLVPVVGFFLLVSVTSCGGSEKSGSSAESKIVALPDSAYRAEITVDSPPPTAPAGGTATATVTIKNVGDKAWPANGNAVVPAMVHLSYHWLDKDGNVIVQDGIRTALPTSLNPGASVSVKAKVVYPKSPGDYILEFDMVHELITWFALKKSQTAKIEIKVT